MKSIYIGLIIFVSAFTAPVSAQMTAELCRRKAKANYPLVRQYDLIARTAEYNLSNAGKGYLPQLNISAKATYQSEVTELPIKLPNMKLETMDKDQYQAVAELSQLVWDGGVIGSQKKITTASSEMEKARLDVDMYALNDRVDELYFGILLIGEQLKQNEVLQNELKTNHKKISAYIHNGIASQADLDAVQVELLNTAQKMTELLSVRKSYCEMLSLLTGEIITENTELIKPDVSSVNVAMDNNRPELSFYKAQTALYNSQYFAITAANLPRISLFVQGGYGKPGLNMLKSEFSSYYLGGIRLSWNFGGFYTQSNSREIIELNKKSVDAAKETFLLNNKILTTRQNNDIDKMRRLMLDDDEIISLRSSIKKTAGAKVENGTLSVTDLIREINAENTAILNKALHEIQLINAVYKLKNTLNN